mmetsp:Transcript_14202/g.36289  ORF Transcript_14202/g.36289 Transcript_14202/m.36289 type:complete len:210 (-) Transcript_14202:8-637(-)
MWMVCMCARVSLQTACLSCMATYFWNSAECADTWFNAVMMLAQLVLHPPAGRVLAVRGRCTTCCWTGTTRFHPNSLPQPSTTAAAQTCCCASAPHCACCPPTPSPMKRSHTADASSSATCNPRLRMPRLPCASTHAQTMSCDCCAPAFACALPHSPSHVRCACGCGACPLPPPRNRLTLWEVLAAHRRLGRGAVSSPWGVRGGGRQAPV